VSNRYASVPEANQINQLAGRHGPIGLIDVAARRRDFDRSRQASEWSEERLLLYGDKTSLGSDKLTINVDRVVIEVLRRGFHWAAGSKAGADVAANLKAGAS
jgi:hypothetical protein